MKIRKRGNLQKNSNNTNKTTLKNVQRLFFHSQLILVSFLAIFLGGAGTLVNLHFETEKRDQNLQNVAEAIARSPLLMKNTAYNQNEMAILVEYLDSLKETLEDIDIISIVNENSIRVYHSNHSLIGTVYDGNFPKFNEENKDYYAFNETGPSGSQRRTYAAIYDENGNYVGFVMSIMLMKNIKIETLQMLLIFFIITIVAILIDLIISAELSEKVKRSLLGYEPDVFTAMYKMRDNILETLEEGILAVDKKGTIQFINNAAIEMFYSKSDFDFIGKNINVIGDTILSNIMLHGNKELHINIAKADIIVDRIPIKEDREIVGAIAILHDRAEYTKLMEDLSGTRYLVDSMRANNHDFTNKLHVILGLIQMEMYEEAISYIQNITIVQRAMISKVMYAVNEPAVAALLIGKIARAAELNVKFALREGCHYVTTDMHLPSEMLITVLGNVLDNAFEAMNEHNNFEQPKELLFGIFSKPGAMLITIDDTGKGICKENLEHIFENGYSTKGEGRGTGLYQVKTMVENFGGRITVESQSGVGTSFSISFVKE